MTNHYNDAYGRRNDAQRQPRRDYNDRDDRPQSEFDRSAQSRDENEGGRYRSAQTGRGRSDEDTREGYPGSEYASRNYNRPYDSQMEDANGWPTGASQSVGGPYEGASQFGAGRSATGQGYGLSHQQGVGGQRSQQGYGTEAGSHGYRAQDQGRRGYGSQGQGSQGYGSQGQSAEHGVMESDYDRDNRPSYGRDRSQLGTSRAYDSDWGFDRGSSSSTHVRGSAPKGYTRSDDRIKEDLSERFMTSAGIDASEIEIDVKDSEVTLKGTVESRSHKFRAEQIAESILGVKDVNNQLRIKRAGDKDASRESTRDYSQSSSAAHQSATGTQQSSTGTATTTASGRRS